MLGLLASSPAGFFRGKPGLRMLRPNIRCSTLVPFLALDACTLCHTHCHYVCSPGCACDYDAAVKRSMLPWIRASRQGLL